jgi:hypothetical protein
VIIVKQSGVGRFGLSVGVVGRAVDDVDVEPAVVVVVKKADAGADGLQNVGFSGVPILCFQTVRPAFSEMS